MKVSLYQGKAMKNMGGHISESKIELDPCLFCTSFKKHRFFIFSKRLPEESQEKTSNVSRGNFLSISDYSNFFRYF